MLGSLREVLDRRGMIGGQELEFCSNSYDALIIVRPVKVGRSSYKNDKLEI